MKLAVEVVSAQKLTPRGRSRGTANAFVEVTFDGRRSRTLTKHNDANPSWNETLVFDIGNPFELVDRAIDVDVYHERYSSDAKQQRSPIGRVRLSWSSVAPSSVDAPVQLYPLEKRTLFSGGVGGGELALRVYFVNDYFDAADRAPPSPASRTNTYSPVSPQSVRSEGAAAASVSRETTRQSPRVRKLHSVGTASKHGAKSDMNHERTQQSRPGTRFFNAQPTAAPPVVAVQPPPSSSSPPPPPPPLSSTHIPPPLFPPLSSTHIPPPLFHPPLFSPPLKPISVDAKALPPAPTNSTYRPIPTKPDIDALREKSKFGFLFGGDNERIANSYDLVEQTHYLYVSIVQARDLPNKDLTGSLDPYVEVKLGNYKNKTKQLVKNQNPEWNVVFAFSQEHQQSSQLEVIVKDHKDLAINDFVGKVVLELVDVPERKAPKNAASPQWYHGAVAPQWYPLMDKKGERVSGQGQLMMAVWRGTQADEAYTTACHSDALDIDAVPQTRSKVYFTPRMCYLRVLVIEAQDLERTVAAAPVVVKIELGSQTRPTIASPPSSGNPTWNQEIMFVAYEPFDEKLRITVMELVERNKEVPVGELVLTKSEIKTHADHKTHKTHADHKNHKTHADQKNHKMLLPHSQWYDLSRPDSYDIQIGGHRKSKIHLRAFYDASYHVHDEPIPFSSDYEPSQKSIRKEFSIGVLDLGILEAKNLLATKPGNGKGAIGPSAYCVGKYGSKWVRTRTVVNTPSPRWQEQYSWDVYEPYTVLTIAVFDNWHVHVNGNGNGSDVPSGKDRLLGKIRLRLSTLEFGRVYTYYYPLLVVHPSGLTQTGELHLAFRFTCTDWTRMLLLYTKHLYPKVHYLLEIPPLQSRHLIRQAVQISVSKLARAEPPLRKEVVEAILYDVHEHDAFSMRTSKAHTERIKLLLSGLHDLAAWFHDVQQWKSPSVTILLHVLLVILVWSPDLILPTLFLYLFAVCAWSYRYRPRDPPHYDVRLSQALTATSEELDEEFDLPGISARRDDIVAHRYSKLRNVAGTVQTMMGDLANHGERISALWSWRDPRATFMFLVCAAMAAAFTYLVPSKLLFAIFGLYLLRHPKLRTKSPSLPINFFKRLPGKSDMML